MQKSLFDHSPSGPIDSDAITAGFNSAQREAVEHGDGPILVIAGAGTGKTRTLVCRLAHLMSRGIAAENILLLTFTRKAAEEMIRRAQALVGDDSGRLTGGTFHSVANLLLRRYARHLGYDPAFVISDRGDAEGVVNLLRSSLNLGGRGRKFPSRRMVVNIISRAVNRATTIGAVIEGQYPHLIEFQGDIETLAEHYRRFKRDHQLMDYDDLLVNLRDLLRDFPEVREEISGRFSHILVDEYQDTNPIQAEIVRLISAPRNNVMVVGDDAQSIYSFRGADFRNIIEFPNLFPGTRVVRLEENYRSTQNILDLGNEVIAAAGEGFKKRLFTSIKEGEKPLLYPLSNEAVQARYVANEIDKLIKAGEDPSEIAVLFRSGFHSYKLEIELGSLGIAYEKRGGMKLLESAHIKDLICYFRLLVNPHDSLSWNRLLLMLPKMGPKTAAKVVRAARESDDPFAALEEYPSKGPWAAGLKELALLLVGVRGGGMDPKGIFGAVMEGYLPLLENLYPDDYPKRLRDLEHIGILLEGYADIPSFLDDIALDPPEAESFADGTPSSSVILSTIHSAKGLEWDNVFVINLASGRFPSSQAEFGPELEEERRLFYVAVTRARRRVFLTYPREVQGYGGLNGGGPSPFVSQLSRDLVNIAGIPYFSPKASGGALSSRSRPAVESGRKKADPGSFEVGDRVLHPFFSTGTIIKKNGAHKVLVAFDRHGNKELHLDYAKLEKA